MYQDDKSLELLKIIFREVDHERLTERELCKYVYYCERESVEQRGKTMTNLGLTKKNGAPHSGNLSDLLVEADEFHRESGEVSYDGSDDPIVFLSDEDINLIETAVREHDPSEQINDRHLEHTRPYEIIFPP